MRKFKVPQLSEAICFSEFSDICMLCAQPDINPDYDNDTDTCKYDGQKVGMSCPGFICTEQCRFCDPGCRFLDRGDIEDEL
jgi:hypothetical protein